MQVIIINFYCTSSNQAEVWALKYTVKIVLSHNLQKIKIQINSQVLVTTIDEDTTTPNLSAMIYDCRLLLKALKDYKLRHVYREANAVADLLDKHRLSEKYNFYYVLSTT